MIEQRIIKEDEFSNFTNGAFNPRDQKLVNEFYKRSLKTKHIVLLKRLHGAFSSLFLINPKNYHPKLKIYTRFGISRVHYLLPANVHVILGLDSVLSALKKEDPTEILANEEKRDIVRDGRVTSKRERGEKRNLSLRKELQKVRGRPRKAKVPRKEIIKEDI